MSEPDERTERTAADARAFVLAAAEPAWRRLAPASAAADVLARVLDAYAGPGRHYHDVAHVADTVAEFRHGRLLCADPDAVLVALAYHDAVYDPRRSDNEARSAEWARKDLIGGGATTAAADAVARLVMATSHHGTVETLDEQLIADVDLAILGADGPRFDAYERAIRLEYAHVPDAAFAAGRTALLRQFLDRPAVYATPVYRARYEVAARRNLERSIAKWTAGAGSG